MVARICIDEVWKNGLFCLRFFISRLIINKGLSEKKNLSMTINYEIYLNMPGVDTS